MVTTKIMYSLGNILALPLIIGLWVNLIVLLSIYKGGQSDFYLVEAVAGKTVRELESIPSSRELISEDFNDSGGESISTTQQVSKHIHSDKCDDEETSDELQASPIDVNLTYIADEISENVIGTSLCDPIQVQLNEQTTNNNINKQILTRKIINDTCKPERGEAARSLKKLTEGFYLEHCFRYKLSDLIPAELFNFLNECDRRTCIKTLEELIQLDETIDIFDNLFITLLSRYNCHNGYSVKWNCDDCKRAYKDWLCATHLTVYTELQVIKPCISFCERVEQRCPYLHPITREQYGGQPVFICRDPNIPFVPEITPDIPYNEPGKCYDLCHLDPNSTELTIDSLSKYDYCKCPSLISISKRIKADARPIAPAPTGLTIYDSGFEVRDGKKVDAPNAHHKRLMELLEVLTNYKNQSKTHRYHADHSSIEHSRSQNTNLHQMS